MSGPGPGAHYVYELPARVMCDFYRVMDSLGGADWARFASCIVTDMTELRLLENRGEPGRTENVVWHLINRNGTVGQLLDILTSLGLWRARDIILSWRPLPTMPPPRMDPYFPVPAPEPSPAPAPAPPFAWSSPGKSRHVQPSEKETVTIDSPLPKAVLPCPPTPPDSMFTDRGKCSFNSMGSLSKALPCPVSSEKFLFYWPLHELKQGTGNFAEQQKIGEGGFGCVYRALMRYTEYAVKRLKEDSNLDWKTVRGSFQTELEKLYQYRHPNIVDLSGCCVEDGAYCLVYMYMPNGSLQDRLQCQNSTAPLSWERRLDVAIGVARAIQFLHSSTPSLIHGDVKSSNILLDENFVAKLSDFGLARFSSFSNNSGKSSMVARTRNLRGTLAYLPDEYIKTGQLAVELDTYSFGVVLLELLTGRKALESDGSTESKYLKDIIKKEDEGKESVGQVADRICRAHLDKKVGSCAGDVPVQLCRLACECLNRWWKKRPKMATVYEKLQQARELLRASASRPDPSLPVLPVGGKPDLPSERPAEALADRLHRSSPSPAENTYRFASQPLPPAPGPPSRESSSRRHPRPVCSAAAPARGALETASRRNGASPSLPAAQAQRGHSSCADSSSGYLPLSSLSQPVESDESSMDDGGGGGDSGSLNSRLWPALRPSTPDPPRPAFARLPPRTDQSPSGLPSLPGPPSRRDSRGAEPLSLSDRSTGSSFSSRQIVMNPAKQKILEQFALYNAGQIDSGELLSSSPGQEMWSREERRAPEESDDFD